MPPSRRTDDGDAVHEGFVDDERRVLGPQRRHDQHVQTAVDPRDIARDRTRPRTAPAARAAARFSRAWYSGPTLGSPAITTSKRPRRRRAASIRTCAPLCQAIVPTKPMSTWHAGPVARDGRLRPEPVVRDLDATLVQAEPDILPRERRRRRDEQIDVVEDLSRARRSRAANLLPGSRACIGSRRAAASVSTGSKPAAGGRCAADEASTGRPRQRLPATICARNGRAAKHRLQRIRVDLVTDVRLRDVDALPAGRADQRVVVQRRNGRNPARASHSRQVEREIQQVVDVKDLRPRGLEHVNQLRRHAGAMRRCPRSDPPPSC